MIVANASAFSKQLADAEDNLSAVPDEIQAKASCTYQGF